MPPSSHPDQSNAVDDAFGGYRGMWRDAENEVQTLRTERDRYRRALRTIIEDSARPELADAEYLRGVAIEALA